MGLTYKVEVLGYKSAYKRGQMVKVELNFKDTSANIDACYGEVPMYNIKKQINKSGENRFALAVRIPIIAPRGEYQVRVYGISKELGKGPVNGFTIKIV